MCVCGKQSLSFSPSLEQVTNDIPGQTHCCRILKKLFVVLKLDTVSGKTDCLLSGQLLFIYLLICAISLFFILLIYPFLYSLISMFLPPFMYLVLIHLFVSCCLAAMDLYPLAFRFRPNVMIKWLVLLLHMWEVPCSDICPETA